LTGGPSAGTGFAAGFAAAFVAGAEDFVAEADGVFKEEGAVCERVLLAAPSAKASTKVAIFERPKDVLRELLHAPCVPSSPGV